MEYESVTKIFLFGNAVLILQLKLFESHFHIP
jgi:hypothetical protein